MNALYLGLLSGTSMDGIDVALVDDQQKLLASNTYPYDNKLRTRLLKVASGELVSIAEIAKLDREIGLAFAKACNTFLKENKLSRQDIQALGSHGQTLTHNPAATPANTLQLGCPHTIAIKTGIETVADFRRADIAYGGQGAPLAPLYHRELFKNHAKPLAVVNIGGIANLSYLGKDGIDCGYDTGPGNGLLDSWIYQSRQANYDKAGAWGKSGQLIPDLLRAMLGDPYFSQPIPKSLDRYHFDLHWLEKFSPAQYQAADVQATLTHFTAKSIALALEKHPERPKELIICGGGSQNPFLLACIIDYCPKITVKRALDYQWNDNYIEAMLFAWLARQRIHGLKMDLKPFTGSSAKHYAGVIYSASSL